MTLCFFSAQYLPTVGGVERYTFQLAKRAAADGHRAIVVTSALPGLPEQETDPNGIEIFRLPVWPVMKGRFPVLRPGADFVRLTRQLFSLPIDRAVVQTKMYTESVWAACALRRRGVPFLVIDHSTGFMPMGGGLPGFCGRLYERMACAVIRAQGPAFYGVSQAVCGWLERGFGITAAGCLPNAVDPDALRADGGATDWRARLGLGPQTRLAAFVGRLIPEKGAGALAEAVRSLPGTALLVAGDGPLRAALAAGGPPVFCPGNLSPAEVAALLRQADVYCLPTRYAEGFPTTLLEAAACRCPIVCTHTAGTGELLPGPDYAVFLEDVTPAAIAAGLRAVLEDPAAAACRAERACQNVERHFTWDAVYAMLLEQLAQPGRA